MLNPLDYKTGGRRRSRGLKTKTLRRMCKSKGLKTTGKKATLMKRLHMRGGATKEERDAAIAAAKAMPATTPAEIAARDAAIADAEAMMEEEEPPVKEEPPAAAAPAAAAAAVEDEGGRRRRRRSRRRSRRREGGGKRRQSRRKITEVALGH